MRERLSDIVVATSQPSQTFEPATNCQRARRQIAPTVRPDRRLRYSTLANDGCLAGHRGFADPIVRFTKGSSPAGPGMTCPACGRDNPVGQKFCGECGARLANICGGCGTTNPPGQKFCGECGRSLGTLPTPASAARGEATPRFASPDAYTPRHLAERILTSKAALEGERKQVTVLFADMKGSMELLADRDPEEARAILDPVLERMMDAVHRYEGTVNQVMGDGIMALFGAPVAHGDHAVRACYAALRIQESVKQYADEGPSPLRRAASDPSGT